MADDVAQALEIARTLRQYRTEARRLLGDRYEEVIRPLVALARARSREISAQGEGSISPTSVLVLAARSAAGSGDHGQAVRMLAAAVDAAEGLYQDDAAQEVQ